MNWRITRIQRQVTGVSGVADRSQPERARATGFTLIEMIGVLAIMAIMAAVVVPSVLKSVERAAVKTEIQSAQNLAESVKLYLKTNGVLPTTVIPPTLPNWTTQLATFGDLSPNEIAVSKWGPARVFVTDPATVPASRAIILSSMRTGLAVPTAANLNTPTRFADVWDTPDGVIPTGASGGLWVGWTAATAPLLTVQRISLAGINSDLRTITVTLNNQHATLPVKYTITPYGGPVGGIQTINPLKTATPSPVVRPRDRLDLYNTAGVLNYAQVFGTSSSQPVSFRYDATLGQWMTQ